MHHASAPAVTIRAPHPVAGRAAVAGVVLIGALLLAVPAVAQVGDPVDPDDPTTTTTEALGDEEPGPTATDVTPTTAAPRAAEEGSGDDGDPTAGAETTTDDEGEDGPSPATLAIVAAGAFLLGLVLAAVPLGLALSRRKRPHDTTPVPPGPAAVLPRPAPAGAPGPLIGPAPTRDETQLRSQREALIDGLIALRDQLPSAALADEASRALAAAGVTEIRPDGETFDPARHRAAHQVQTADQGAHDTVASTERVGYADGTRSVRLPEVVVARHGALP